MAFADDNGQRLIVPPYYGPPSAYPGQGAINDPGPGSAAVQGRQNFGAYLATDPGYAALLASLRGQQAGLVNAFGDATGISGIDGSPLGADVATAAANNPFSWLAMDRRATQRNIGSVQNSANARGLLYSGANAQGQANEYAADQQRQSAARQALQNSLLGLGGQQAQGLTTAYQNYMASLNKQATGG